MDPIRTYILLFTLLFILPGCNRSARQVTFSADGDKSCIESVIAMDDSLGRVRNHACEQISLSKTIKNYARGLKKLDFRDCPSDFALAFERHRLAWLDVLAVTDKYPDLRGEMHDLFDQLEQGDSGEEFAPLLKAVWDTWSEIEEAMKQ